jgi:ribosomal subunit interface protein
MTIDDIVITGDNFETTAAMEELIHKKFNRLLNHYGHFMTDMEIILKIDNDHRNISEVNVNVPEKKLNASASTDDMYKSLDEMIHKLKTQLEKYKELHFGHQKEQRAEQAYKEEALTDESAEKDFVNEAE